MPPRVFFKTSLQVIENKRWESGKVPQENSRARKRKEGKEIEELKVVEEKISASLVRDGDDGIVVVRWVRGRWGRGRFLRFASESRLRGVASKLGDQ
jgi:hypothetical protein